MFTFWNLNIAVQEIEQLYIHFNSGQGTCKQVNLKATLRDFICSAMYLDANSIRAYLHHNYFLLQKSDFHNNTDYYSSGHTKVSDMITGKNVQKDSFPLI